MATSPAAMPPPPGVDQSTAPAPTSPTAAAPAPAKPSPQMQQGTQIMLGVVNGLRDFAKMFPGASPYVQQMNDLARQAMRAMMESAEVGEPAAPPITG